MGQLEDLIARRNIVAANIEKACNTGFDLNEELEKARSGVYADTAENRRLNRVGQKYGSEKKEDEPKGQREKKQEEEGSGKTVSEHAAGASDEALKRAAADDKASPEVKAAAEEEMKKRNSGNEEKSDGKIDVETFNSIKGVDECFNDKTFVKVKGNKPIEVPIPLVRLFIQDRYKANFIKEIKDKFNIDVDPEIFNKEKPTSYRPSKEKNGENRQHVILYNPNEKKFGEFREMRDEIEKEYIEKNKPDGEKELNFLEENQDFKNEMNEYILWGEEADVTPENLEKIKNIEKNYNYKLGKTFDWRDSDEAEEYKIKMKNKGYAVVDLGDGDTNVFYLFKRKQK